MDPENSPDTSVTEPPPVDPEPGAVEQPATVELDTLVEYLRDRVQAYTESTASHAFMATTRIAVGDYSAAAAWCHRAHQHSLIREELRQLLEQTR
jgi:hypothetical protein